MTTNTNIGDFIGVLATRPLETDAFPILGYLVLLVIVSCLVGKFERLMGVSDRRPG